MDFEDGELKTNKCDASGKPKETVFITQIAGVIDELIEEKTFEETHLYEKINNILRNEVSVFLPMFLKLPNNKWPKACLTKKTLKR